jgi:hypothetical protein
MLANAPDIRHTSLLRLIDPFATLLELVVVGVETARECVGLLILPKAICIRLEQRNERHPPGCVIDTYLYSFSTMGTRPLLLACLLCSPSSAPPVPSLMVADESGEGGECPLDVGL